MVAPGNVGPPVPGTRPFSFLAESSMTEMRFRNFGGIHQFMVSNEDDLARIDDLDPARWAATSAC